MPQIQFIPLLSMEFHFKSFKINLPDSTLLLIRRKLILQNQPTKSLLLQHLLLQRKKSVVQVKFHHLIHFLIQVLTRNQPMHLAILVALPIRNQPSPNQLLTLISLAMHQQHQHQLPNLLLLMTFSPLRQLLCLLQQLVQAHPTIC